MHAFTDMQPGNFAPELLASLHQTPSANPWKFDRFAKQVLGADYPRGQLRGCSKALRATISAMLRRRAEQPAARAVPAARRIRPHRCARAHRQHRVRRSPRSKANYQVGDAPVSYPYLWNIWKFDWVQYNGSVAQPLARNVGEALGVGAVAPLLNAVHEPLPPGSVTAARWTSPDWCASSTRCSCCGRLRWPEEISRRHRSRQGGAWRGAVQAALPGMSRTARRRARAPAGQRAAQAHPELEWRIEVIPLRAHRHRSQLPPGFHGAALRPVVDRAHQRGSAARAAATADALAAARRALPPAGSGAAARRCGRAAGRLPAELSAYPDPDADATPTFPTAASPPSMPRSSRCCPRSRAARSATASPTIRPDCGLDCHLRDTCCGICAGAAPTSIRRWPRWT